MEFFRVKISVVSKLTLFLLLFYFSPFVSRGTNKDPHAINTTVYYIDPAGCDKTGNGSKENPWSSLFFACSRVNIPGSVIHINPGIYNETKTCALASGVNIEGEGDISHIISHMKRGTGAISLISSSRAINNGNQKISFIRLDGELIANRAFYINNRNNVAISHCTIIDFRQKGIYAYNPPNNNPSSNLIIENCNFRNTGTSITLTSVSSSITRYCVFKEDERPGEICRIRYSRNCSGMIYHDNISYKPSNNLGKWNFTFEDWDTKGGNEVYDNEFYGGGQHIDIAGVANVKGEYDFSWWIHHNKFQVNKIEHPNGNYNYAICFEGTNEDAIINNNIFINFDRPFSINISQSSRYVRNIRFCYNICQNTGGPFGHAGRNIQIYIESPQVVIEDIFIDNNVLSGAGNLASNIFIQSVRKSEIRNIFIRNNIIEKTNSNVFRYGWLIVTSRTNANNFYIQNNILFDNYLNNRIAGKIRDLTYTNNIIADPLFVKPGTDFRLKPDSPAIKAGINIGLNRDLDKVPIEFKPDIGAFEYKESYNSD